MTDYITVIPEQPVVGKPLGAHFDNDPRNVEYPMSASLPGVTAQPRSAPWTRRQAIWEQVGNSCVAQAVAGLAVTDPWFVGMSVTQLAIAASASDKDGRGWLYHDAQTEDGIQGPHEGTTLSAGFRAAHTLDLQPTDTDNPFAFYVHSSTVADITAYLDGNGPLALAVPWFEGFDTPDGDGKVRATGAIRGGHAICAVWHDAQRGWVKCAQSWGPNWGIEGGYFYFPLPELQTCMDHGGQAMAWHLSASEHWGD